MENINYFTRGKGTDPSNWIFSNSALSTICSEQGGHPKKLIKFFSEDIEEQINKSLERGKLLHSYMEHPTDFVISEVPKPDAKLGLVCDVIIRDIDNTRSLIDQDILDACREVGWNNKWKDEAIIKNANKDNQISNYIEEVLKNEGKQILSKDTKIIIDNCINGINNNKYVSAIIYSTPNSHQETLKELEIYWTSKGLNKKAKLDRVDIDYNVKLIRYYDYKTTSKPISLFQNSFEYYHYYRQHAFYMEALFQFLEQKGEITASWKIECFNIVVETTGVFNCAIFPVSTFWINEGIVEQSYLEERINKHYELNEWNYSIEEIENFGQINLYNRFITK